MPASSVSRSPRFLVLGAVGFVLAAVLLATATGAVSASLGGVGAATGGATDSGTTDATITVAPSATARSDIPAGMLSLYEVAAATCPGLPWTVLAAIGTVESGNGTSELPGVHAGANAAGAEGPMQFEPRTFVAYDEPVPPDGADPPSPYDPTDAVYAAARMLCADGAAHASDVATAVFAYNHSARYVAEVLSLAQSYGQPDPASTSTATTAATATAATAATATTAPDGASSGGAGTTAVDWALAQVGTPYLWGGETPGVGFDCSGLTQAAYRVAGIVLPRVAQDQFDAGPPLGTGTVLAPGDLVFFGDGAGAVSHVGLYVGVRGGKAMMVDAPHSGAEVRVEAFPPDLGALWGSELVVGFTRPGV